MLRGKKVSLGVERDETGYQVVKSIDDVYEVYPLTAADIKARTQHVKEEIQKEIDAICALSKEEQTKETVLYAGDKAGSYLGSLMGDLELIHMVSPLEEVRAVGTQCSQELQKFYVDVISSNKKLYNTLKEYAEKAQKDNLTKEEQYFLDEMLADFKRAGLDLPDEELQKVVELQKKLAELETQFQVNIGKDTTTLIFKEDELEGTSEDFKKGLLKNEEGLFVVKLDYPTQDAIMRECSVNQTRKKFQQAMSKKAYPKNVSVLNDMVMYRDKLAKLLGFKSYAHLDIDNQMLKTPEKASSLQMDFVPAAVKKSMEEVARFSKNLPKGVEKTKDGKLEPWDLSFIVDRFKKEKYQFDEAKMAEYFPMEATVQGLFEIYQKFFDLSFKAIKNPKTWHKEVQLLEISKKDGTLLGYVFLDMFPRDNKFSHAAQFHGIETRIKNDGDYAPGVCTVVCNFTKPIGSKPSLLKYNEVRVFFHEFGHALHTLLGGRRLMSQSGTAVKRDFVETPSQMLENWMEDKAILKMLGKHYKTGEQLPDSMIEKKLELLKLGTGMYESRQVQLGMFALDLFMEGQEKDIEALQKKYDEMTAPYLNFDPENKMYCSFGHLPGYGAKYYGYLWARILGADIFEHIEEGGLLDSATGKKYADAILVPGGSRDPYEMVTEYLGREPNQKAFLKKNGF